MNDLLILRIVRDTYEITHYIAIRTVKWRDFGFDYVKFRRCDIVWGIIFSVLRMLNRTSD